MLEVNVWNVRIVCIDAVIYLASSVSIWSGKCIQNESVLLTRLACCRKDQIAAAEACQLKFLSISPII